MVTMDNYEEYLLLYADGELDKEEEKALLDFIAAHPELKGEMDLYTAIKLVPDENLVYSNKQQLMKTAGKTVGFRNVWAYGVAAACAAVLIAIGLRNFNDGNNTTGTTIAHVNTVQNSNISTLPKKELHSTPVNPVTVETKKEQKTRPITKAPVYHKPVQQYIASNTQPHPATSNTHITPEPKQTEVATPQQKPETSNTIASATEDKQPQLIPPVSEEIKEDKKGLLASLPVKENLLALNELSKNVGEKFEKIKDIPDKIRDTDVHFRIGKKELFVVKL